MGSRFRSSVSVGVRILRPISEKLNVFSAIKIRRQLQIMCAFTSYTETPMKPASFVPSYSVPSPSTQPPFSVFLPSTSFPLLRLEKVLWPDSTRIESQQLILRRLYG